MNHKKQRIYSLMVVSAFLPFLAVLSGQPLPAKAQQAAKVADTTTACGDVTDPLSGYVTTNANANRPIYERVMNETGVPWEMLAAIHYRETSFSRTNPNNGQGIFQFVNGDGGPYPAGPVGDEEFYRQLTFMANKLQSDYVWRGSAPRERRRLQPNETNAAIVKDTFFSYNGRAGAYANQAVNLGFNRNLEPYEGSPYVMNRFDCARDGMGMITRDFGSLNGTDTRYGAFTVYARLRSDDYWRSLWSAPFGAFGKAFSVVQSSDSNDRRQWVVYDGIKQLIPNNEIRTAWGLQNTQAATFSPSIIDNVPSGPELGRLMRARDSDTQYLVDNGKRYAIVSPAMLDAWNLRNTPLSEVSSELANVPADGGPLTYAVKKEGADEVYRVSGVWAGETILNLYRSKELLTAWEGANPKITELSAGLFDDLDNAIGPVLTTNKIKFDGKQYMVSGGKKLTLTTPIARLYPGGAQWVLPQTLDRLPTDGAASPFMRVDNTEDVYVVDGGKKRIVGNAEVLQAWAPGNTPLVNVVNDAYAKLVPTDDKHVTTSVVRAKNGQSYLLDGRKLPIPRDLEAAYASASALTVSDNFLSTLPTGPNASLYIKVPGQSEVFLMEEGARRQFTDPADLAKWANGSTAFTEVSEATAKSFTAGKAMSAYVTYNDKNYLIDGGKRRTISNAAAAAQGLPATPVAVTVETLRKVPTQAVTKQ